MFVSIMEIFGCLFIIGLSFVFHCVVYEDDYVKKWYWKVLIGGGILAFTFTTYVSDKLKELK